MKNKFLFIIALLFAATGAWAQTTRYVPCGTNTPCYATIQAAIDASTNGDIIEVDAGTYLIPAGTQLIINKQVTLRAKAGLANKPRIRTNLLNWSQCNVNIAADNVVIDGFEIDNALYGTQAGYIVGDYGSAKNNWTVKNCNIHDGRNGIRPVGDYVTIEGNDIHGTNSDCINCEYGKCGGLKVTKNILHSEWIVSGSKPAGITYNCDATTAGDVEISYNYCYACRTFIDFQHNGGTAPANNILIMHNTVDWKMEALPSPITGNEIAQQMSIAFWGIGNWTASKFTIRDNIFSRQKWYEIVNTSGAGGPIVGSMELKNNLFSQWYLNNAWYPGNASPNEWPAARGAVGWNVTDADFTFTNDIQGDPLYKATGTTAGEYYSLITGSPAHNAASDGTDIGAWQTPPVHNITQDTYFYTIQDAIDAAVSNDIIEIASGTLIVTSQVNVNKANLKIQGVSNTSTKIQVSGTGYRFYISASGVTIQNLEIEKTDKTTQDIIGIHANNTSIKNNIIHGQFVIGDGEVSRAMMVEAGNFTGLLMSGNTIFGLRQPAYVNGEATGVVSNNYTYKTKGWVIATKSNLNFSGNTWGTGSNVNYYDIAIFRDSPEGANNYPDIVTMSANNNDAIIENQHSSYSPAILSIVHIDKNTTTTGNNGSILDPYNTISPAIPRVAPGGKIYVAAGTYNENLIITKPVTILGPNVNVDPNTGSRVGEATINGGGGTAIIPQVGGIVINGFTIITTDAGFPIYTGGTSVTGLTISNNIISTGIRAVTIATNGNDISILHNRISGYGYGIHFGNGTYGNVKINNNRVNGPNVYYAIFINGTGTIAGFELKDNMVYDVSNIAANITNGTVSGNTFDVNTGALCLQINLHNSTLSGNTFEGHSTTAGLQLFGSQYGGVPSNTVTVSGNVFSNCGVAGPYWTFGLQLSPDIDHITITNNTFTNCYDGVNTRDITSWDFTGKDIHVNNNSITGSTHYGVKNSVTGTLDAECNYWGTTVPSEVAAKISGNVNFVPWLISGVDGDLVTAGFQPLVACASCNLVLSTSSTIANCPVQDGTASVSVNSGGISPYTYLWSNSATTSTITGLVAGSYTVTVTDINGCTASATATVSNSLAGPVHNTNTGLNYCTIQAAINDPLTLNGHVITVDAGTYTEQVLIQKSLTLSGAGIGNSIIKTPTTRTLSIINGTDTWDYLVAAYPASGTINVHINGFTMDANGTDNANGTTKLAGVFMRDVSGTGAGLFSSEVHNFGTTAYTSWGFATFRNSSLTIDGNTIGDFTRDGILVKGGDGSYPDPKATISNNTVTGNSTALNGINVNGGAAVAYININHVTGLTRNTPWAGCGILLSSTSPSSTITGNTVEECWDGVGIQSVSGLSIDGNIIKNIYDQGIGVDNSNNCTFTNNSITDCKPSLNAGILLVNSSTGNIIGTSGNGNTIALPVTGTGNLYGINLPNTIGAGNNAISYNTFNGGQRFIQIDGGNTGTTTITHNTMGNTTAPIYGAVSMNGGSANITYNTLTNTVRPMEFYGAINLDINNNTVNGANWDGINLGNVSGTKSIENNTISNCTGGNGIHGRADADNLDIECNEITGCSRGIMIESGCTGVSITNNTIHDNLYSGIELHEVVSSLTGNKLTNVTPADNRGIETFTSLTAHDNFFSGFNYGAVIFAATGTFNVTDNWWGNAAGPSAYLNGINLNTYNQANQVQYIQANSYSNFTFVPWLNSGVDNVPGTCGFQPATGTSFAPVYANATGDAPETEKYASIQAAVAATTLAYVKAKAGTFTEQVSVNKNLTLIGSGAGTTTIQAPGVLTSDPDGAKTLVLFTGAITAEFSGFTVQGPVTGLTFGIYIRAGATANIHDNVIKDIRDEPLSGAQHGVAIEVGKYSDTEPFVNQTGTATITDNTISGYQKTGIAVEHTGSSATITGNMITGAGPISTTAQNGIQIRRGATGTIETNTVTGNAYDGPTYSAEGIGALHAGYGVVIQGNTVNHNGANIYCWKSDGVHVLDNLVSDASPVDENSSAGIAVESDGTPSSYGGSTGPYVTDVIISGNTIQNNLSGGLTHSDGIDLYPINGLTVSGNTIVGSGYDGIWIGGSLNVTITGNQFSGNGLLVADPNAAAIDLGNGAPNTLGGFSIHYNSFIGNRMGISNYDAGSVNATNNYWGGCPLVYGNVSYYPYYSTCTGTPGSFVFGGQINNIVANASQTTICAGSSTTIFATGGSDYIWDNGLGLGSSKVVSPAINTTYNVTANDANGCTGASASVTITVNPLPVVLIEGSASGSSTIVLGNSKSLTASGATSYLWNTGSTANPITVSPATITSYSVVGTTGSCSASATHTVNVISVSAGSNQSICQGGSANLNATVTGVTVTSYSWSPAGSLSNPIIQNPVATPTITTTYTVTVNDIPDLHAQVTVFVHPKPVANAGPDIIIAPGGSGTLSGSATGGSTPYSWSWTGPSGFTSSQQNPTVNTAGTYTLIVTDAFGCVSDPDQAIVTVAISGYTVSGNIAYAYGTVNSQMHNVTVTLKQGGVTKYTAVTPASGNGNYQFLGVTSGTYDVYFSLTTTWGGLTPADITAIQKHYTPPVVLLHGIKLLAADVYLNSPVGLVDVNDRNLVNQRRLNSNCGCFTTGDWVFTKAEAIGTDPGTYIYANSSGFSNMQIIVNAGDLSQDFRSLCYGDVDASYTGLKEFNIDNQIVDVTNVDTLQFINYPNPFSDHTTLSYSLPVAGDVQICIYNLMGERVGLLEKPGQTEGVYEYKWNTTDLSQGIYLGVITLKTSDDILRRHIKMLLYK